MGATGFIAHVRPGKIDLDNAATMELVQYCRVSTDDHYQKFNILLNPEFEVVHLLSQQEH